MVCGGGREVFPEGFECAGGITAANHVCGCIGEGVKVDACRRGSRFNGDLRRCIEGLDKSARRRPSIILDGFSFRFRCCGIHRFCLFDMNRCDGHLGPCTVDDVEQGRMTWECEKSILRMAGGIVAVTHALE
jgi:hypothetical protein